MPKCKFSLGTLHRNLICLAMGLLIGIQMTSIWYDMQSDNSNDNLLEDYETLAASMEAFQLLPEYLFNNTRVLCWIMTKPENHFLKAIHIRHTWGKRCNKLIFMSTEEDDELPSVQLPVEEGRHNLWNKTKEALKYIYDHHYDEADWFLKADDDTYVIMENLRYLLYPYSPETPIYFGAKFKPYIKQGYMSGGAGYVLSKESLKKFALEAYNNKTSCSKVFKSEDVQLGYCLQNIGVQAGDSRDEESKERFIPLAVDHVIPQDISNWYQNYTFYKPQENSSCCSANAISFHYIEPYKMYALDYLIYSLRVFGIGPKNGTDWGLPMKLNGSDIGET